MIIMGPKYGDEEVVLSVQVQVGRLERTWMKKGFTACGISTRLFVIIMHCLDTRAAGHASDGTDGLASMTEDWLPNGRGWAKGNRAPGGSFDGGTVGQIERERGSVLRFNVGRARWLSFLTNCARAHRKLLTGAPPERGSPRVCWS